jgi:protein-tyrosine phosphatase
LLQPGCDGREFTSESKDRQDPLWRQYAAIQTDEREARKLLALVLLTLAGATPEEIIADYLLTYHRMKQRYAEIGAPDQLAAVSELLASHDTTIEASLISTIESLTMPGFLLENGLSDTELAALRTRLTT